MARFIDADKLLKKFSPYTKEWSEVYLSPTADVVEVKHGHWNDVQYTYFGLKRYICSECSDDEYWEKRYLEHKESFCPNCGADMRGEK